MRDTATVAHRARTVAVTGASGFIGGRLVEALVADGADVTGVVRDFRRAARLGRLDMRIARADMRDAAAVNAALDGADLVFHCAYGWDDVDAVERADNVVGSVNVARAVARRDGARLVHVSTMAIYGHDLPDVVDEDTPPRPATPYGETKLEVEQALRALADAEGIDLRVVRATKVFGPYDFGFTVRTVRSLLERRLWLIEDGSGIVAPSYVDNLVHGLLLAAAAESRGGTHLISDGVNLTWRELYGRFASITGGAPYGSFRRDQAAASAGAPPAPGEREYRDFMRGGAYSIARAQRDLGYHPIIPFDEAMTRTAAWLRFAGIFETRGARGAA